jgi:hypothetical protein
MFLYNFTRTQRTRELSDKRHLRGSWKQDVMIQKGHTFTRFSLLTARAVVSL